MKNYIKISLAITLLLSLSSAGGVIEPKVSMDTQSIETKVDAETMTDKVYNIYNVGASRITLGDTSHNALYLGSKTGYKFTENTSISMVGKSSYYRHIGDINEMNFTGLELEYNIPYTFDKLSVAVAAGLGSNFNYNRLFTDFRKSFDFGFAYAATLDYNINDNWSLSATYSKFDFNTNATQLEDTQPEIISLSVDYKFDAMSFLK